MMADDFLSAGKLELPGSMIGAVRDRAIDSGVVEVARWSMGSGGR